MLKIHYKCRCMQDEGNFKVKYREEHEDIVDWMEVVKEAVTQDHQQRSPLCMAETLEYMKIPISENAEYIGAKPTDH